MARKDGLFSHISRLANIVRSAHLKRALTDIDPNPGLNFWRLIYGTLLDVAVLEWCKVFGTDSEPTHWKRLVADHDAFRKDLLASLKVDEAGWEKYWQRMRDYRNDYVAHHVEESRVDKYPELDLALESSYFYYAFLIKEWRASGDSRLPDDLRDYGANFAGQAKEIAKNALAATV